MCIASCRACLVPKPRCPRLQAIRHCDARIRRGISDRRMTTVPSRQLRDEPLLTTYANGTEPRPAQCLS